MSKPLKVIVVFSVILALGIVGAWLGYRLYVERYLGRKTTTKESELDAARNALRAGAAKSLAELCELTSLEAESAEAKAAQTALAGSVLDGIAGLRGLVLKHAPSSEKVREALKTNLADGIAKLRALIQRDPESLEAGEARIVLGYALAVTGDDAEALALLGVVAADAKAGRRAPRARVLRADILIAKGDPRSEATARSDLQRVEREHLADLQLWGKASLMLGRLDTRSRAYQKAIDRFAKIIDRAMASDKETAKECLRKAVHGRARELADAKEWATLIAWGDDMIKKHTSVPNLEFLVRYRQAAAHRELGSFPTARLYLERLLRDVHPDLLGRDVDCQGQLAAIAQAEKAKGIRRTAGAFRKARQQGTEKRLFIEGDVAADTTWGRDKSPRVVLGTVTVKPAATLTIEAGTRLEFLQESRIVVQGALVVKGTAEAPVVLTSAVAEEKHRSLFDGEGIRLAKGAKCRLEHCVVEHQRHALVCEGASLVLRRCVFRNNGDNAVELSGGAKPTIEDCTFRDNDALAVSSIGSSPLVRRCLIADNRRGGIRFQRESSPRVEACRIARNARYGISCEGHVELAVEGCIIDANRGDGIAADQLCKLAIKNNVIANHPESAIRCLRETQCQIIGNKIDANGDGSDGDAAIYFKESSGTLQANNILDSNPVGVFLSQASPTIKANRIYTSRAVRGIVCADDSQPTINHNAIIARSAEPEPITNTGSMDIDAENNYYGDPNRLKGIRFDRAIYDQTESKDLGLVDWDPRLPKPPPAPPMPKLTGVPDDVKSAKSQEKPKGG